MADIDPRQIEELTNQVNDLRNHLNEAADAGSNLGSRLPGINTKLKNVVKTIGKGSKELRRQQSELEDLEKAVGLARAAVKDREEAIKSMSKTEQAKMEALVALYGKGLVKQRNALKETVSQHSKAYKELTNQAESYYDELEESEKKSERRRARSGIGRKRSYIGEPRSGNLKEAGELLFQVPRRLKGIGTKFYEDMADIGLGKETKGIAGGAALKGASGALSKLGKVLSGVGKAAGVASAGFTALLGVLKIMAKFENVLTNLNRTFLKLAGPTAGIRDVPEAMDEFNKAVVNLRRNLRLGLKAGDIQDLFSAMAGAGMSLQGVKQNIGDYGRAIAEARMLSLQFGVSMQDMGKMVADQMLTLNTSLDDVSDSFNQIAFDASKAGISSTKFYSSIESSTASLAYFGNYLKNISAMLTGFLQASELGFRDAQKATKDMVDSFNKMDYKKGIMLFEAMGGVGGAGFKMMEQAAEKQKDAYVAATKRFKEAQKLAIELPENKKMAEETERLRKEMEKEESRLRSLNNALQKARLGDFSELAMHIGRMADRPYEVMMELMKISGKYLPAQFEVLGKIMGWSQETVYRMKETFRETRKGFSDLISNNQDLLIKVFEGNEEAANIMKDIMIERARGGTGEELMRTLQGVLTDHLVSLGETQEEAQEKVSRLLRDLNKNMDVNLLKGVERLIGLSLAGEKFSPEEINKYVVHALQRGNELQDKEMKMTEKREKDLISSITTAEDFVGIMKEAAGFFGADKIGGLLKTLVAGVGKIGGWVGLIAREREKEAREKLSKEMEEASRYAKAQVKNEEKINNAVEKLIRRVEEQEGINIGEEAALKRLEGYYATGRAPGEYVDIANQYEEAQISLGKMEKRLKYLKEKAVDLGAAYLINEAMQRSKGSFKKELEKERSRMSPQEYAERIGEALNVEISKKEKIEGVSLKGKKVEEELERKKAVKENFSDVSQILYGHLVSEGTRIPPRVRDEETFIPYQRDFKPSKGGLALLDKNDIVFQPPAAGVGGQSGEFMSDMLKEIFPIRPMGGEKPQSVKYEVNLGGLTIQGDATDPVVARRAAENIGEMINQAIRKREYENKVASG